jgi:hypothetical protein
MKKILLLTAALLLTTSAFCSKRNRRDSRPAKSVPHEFEGTGEVVTYIPALFAGTGLSFVAKKCKTCGTYNVGKECGHMITTSSSK